MTYEYVSKTSRIFFTKTVFSLIVE